MNNEGEISNERSPFFMIINLTDPIISIIFITFASQDEINGIK